LATPTLLGRYEVLRPLARGGMAELWLGRTSGQGGFEKLVVLKRIRAELSHQPELIRMFLDEARLAATLQHSNVVQVYDLGEDEAGLPFYAMEYLHGEDLRSIARAAKKRGERIPLEHTLAIAIGASAGLHYAHTRQGSDGQPLGVVHRDVSPHNLYVTYDGGVKVVDFGIAKARNRASETRSGTIKGKAPYMSPEQCAGEPLDARSDVFALSCVLWELTCGETLFGGATDFQIMRAIVDGEVRRPSQVVRGYPPALEKIVLRGLSRRPADRFRTAEELQLALEAFARDERLAVSTVGLARYLRERFAGPVLAWSQAVHSGTHALQSFALERIADRAAEEERDTLASAPTTQETEAPRRTRAVERKRRPAWLWLAALGAAAALASGLGFRMYARHAIAPAAPAPLASSPAIAPSHAAAPLPLASSPAAPPAASAPGVARSPIAIEARPIDARASPPNSPHRSRMKSAHARSPEHRVSSHAKVRAHPAPSAAAPAAVDLDAPLPPR
jgi:hypothetical protein